MLSPTVSQTLEETAPIYKISKKASSRDAVDSNPKSRRSAAGVGGGRVKVYRHAVTDAEAALLANTGHTSPLADVQKKTGADVQFDSCPSTVSGMKIVIIRGVPSQIEEAIRLINQKTGSQETISSQAEKFWLQWVEAAFPDLESRAYFLPPVYFNRVPMTRQSIGGQDVLILQSFGKKEQSNQPIPQPPCVQDVDTRDDAALQRILLCLNTMCERNKEVLVGINQLSFSNYLREPCYAAAAAYLPLPNNLPSSLPLPWKQGDFDILLIHRFFGFVICEVKSFGDNVKTLNMSQQDIDNNIRKKLRDAISQLDKAEAMLSHLVSDIAPGLRITKTIAFPNLTTRQLQQAISGDTRVTQDLCRCLGTSDPADIPGLCLCCDQLSDPKTPWDVSNHVLRELGHWWQRRVTGAGPDPHMTRRVYKRVVARFCGPATTVTVPCTCPPRVSVKTLGQAVWWTGECYTAVITLFPEQVHLLHTAPPRLFVSGPPGTGKTVVLLLMAIQWLRCGHHVDIVSTWWGSRAACSMLYHLLLQTVKILDAQLTGVIADQLRLRQYDFTAGREDVEKAVNDLLQAASEGSSHVIVDEVVPNFLLNFQTFCNELLTQVPRLHLWAASCFHRNAPAGWQVEYLTRPLRSPPAVVREVEQDVMITKHGDVLPYSERGVSDHTDGPPVTRLYHRGQGHSGHWPGDCVQCGREVASFLLSLRVGVTGKSTKSTFINCDETTHPFLQWRDVLVLYYLSSVDGNSAMATTLKEAGIPVRVMEDVDIEDVATARSDVVWMVHGDHIRGLERKVVVFLEPLVNILSSARLHCLSRCTSQLLIVSLDIMTPKDELYFPDSEFVSI